METQLKMETQTEKKPPKPKKVEAVRDLTDRVQRARGIFFTDFKGLTVAEITELRRRCHQSHVDYLVCKNTFARRVLREQGHAEALKHLQGPTALAFGYDDPVAAAKILYEFASKNEKLILKGGVFEGKAVSAKDIQAIKNLPSRAAALSMLVAAVFGPVQGFYNVTAALLRDFVSVIDQIIEQKKAAA
jgi:large subunit ribosomal protein L10